MPVQPQHLMVWLGPRISQRAFSVGEEVRHEISAWLKRKGGEENDFFRSHPDSPHHYLTDLVGLAIFALSVIGVSKLYAVDHCSYSEPDLFFSHRRDTGRTGRMVTLISLNA